MSIQLPNQGVSVRRKRSFQKENLLCNYPKNSVPSKEAGFPVPKTYAEGFSNG